MFVLLSFIFSLINSPKKIIYPNKLPILNIIRIDNVSLSKFPSGDILTFVSISILLSIIASISNSFFKNEETTNMVSANKFPKFN